MSSRYSRSQSSGEGAEMALGGGTGLSPAEKGERGAVFEASGPVSKGVAGSCGLCWEACVGVPGRGSWHGEAPGGQGARSGPGPLRDTLTPAAVASSSLVVLSPVQTPPHRCAMGRFWLGGSGSGPASRCGFVPQWGGTCPVG